MPSASGTCALPMDGANACPPQAGSCFTCPYYKHDRTAPEATPADVKTRIRTALAAWPDGLTFERLAKVARLNPNTVRGRLSELERAGVVKRKRRRHRTASGSRAHLYVLVQLVPLLAAGGTLRRAP